MTNDDIPVSKAFAVGLYDKSVQTGKVNEAWFSMFARKQ